MSGGGQSGYGGMPLGGGSGGQGSVPQRPPMQGGMPGRPPMMYGGGSPGFREGQFGGWASPVPGGSTQMPQYQPSPQQGPDFAQMMQQFQANPQMLEQMRARMQQAQGLLGQQQRMPNQMRPDPSQGGSIGFTPGATTGMVPPQMGMAAPTDPRMPPIDPRMMKQTRGY